MKRIKFFIRNYFACNFVDLLPKFRWVAIQTYPDWEDNGLALHRELEKTSIKKIIWLTCTERDKFPFKTSVHTVLVNRSSLKGFFLSALCKYVFITHGTYFDIFPRRQISVNMWHGFGFKAVGLLNNMNGLSTTYALASSSFSQKFMAQQMGIPEERVLSLGYPRNDRMLEAKLKYNEFRKNLGIPNLEESKLIIWMPTYRRSGEGDVRVDGKGFNNPFNMDEFNLEWFNSFCAEHKIICLLKIHPMAVVDVPGEEFDNVIIINDSWLEEKAITLYQLLGVTDLLISDLSSVITDYLLLDQPIIHAFADLKEYLASRNILLQPPEDFFVGPLVEDQNKLHNALVNNLCGDKQELIEQSKRRNKIRELFFEFDDAFSSRRIVDAVGIK